MKSEMTRDYNHIRTLLAKYYDAETNPREEKALADFFASHSDLPEDLKADKAVFESLRSAAEKIQAPDHLDAIIMDAIDRDIQTRRKEAERKGRNRGVWKTLLAISAAAAVIAVILLIPFTADLKNGTQYNSQLTTAANSDSATVNEDNNVDSIVETHEDTPVQVLVNKTSPNTKMPTRASRKSTSAQAADSEKSPADEGNISEEELAALHEGLMALAKAGRKIAMAKERISDTQNAVSNSLEEISGILRK